MQNHSVIYTPEGAKNEGDASLFLTTRKMLNEIIAAKELVWRLFLRDFTVRYRQSALGILWAVLMPIITVGMFIVMNASGIIAITGIETPYPLYALIGLTVWNLFSVGVSASASSIINAGNMVVKINFPKISLVAAAVGQGLVDFFIRVILVALASIYYGYVPSPAGVLLATLALLPMLLITFGLGCVLSLFAAVVRDIVTILGIVLNAVMLLTPILYPVKSGTILAELNFWNPLNYLVNVPRDFLLKGTSSEIMPFLVVCGICVVVCYLGWRLFYFAQSKIAERV